MLYTSWPRRSLYPSWKRVWKSENLDVRVGMCMISGIPHAGQDPAAEQIKYAERIHDMHIKI